MRLGVRRINAALRFRRFEEWGPEVINDEDIVLGVRPAGYSEDQRLQPTGALAEIDDALDQVSRRVGVLRAETEAEAAGEALPARVLPATQLLGIRPGTAFIIMMMDPDNLELEDVKRAIQEECARFGIHATRADEDEHSGEITHQILDQIRTSEFLIADLTGERPSVYYEVKDLPTLSVSDLSCIAALARSSTSTWLFTTAQSTETSPNSVRGYTSGSQR